ncbi:MAG: nitrogenase component 1 [Treponema sp.]
MKNLSIWLPPFSPDYSGAASVMFDFNALTVMHDAAGCTGNYTGYDEPRWYNSERTIFCSGLREIDAVLGNDKVLADKVIAAAKSLNPALLSLIGTPVPMLIGTDLKGLAKELEAESELPAIGIETTGTAYYDKGIFLAWKELIDKFTDFAGKGTESQSGICMGKIDDEKAGACSLERRVNIIGANPIDFVRIENIESLKTLLANAGFMLNFCTMEKLTVQNVKMLSCAQANIAVSQAGLLIADYIYKKSGMPYIAGYPIGEQECPLFIQKLEDVCSQGKNCVWGIDVAKDTDEQTSVLCLGEQIFYNSLRRALKDYCGIKNICVGAIFGLRKESAQHTDIALCDESEIKAYINKGQCKAIIGDPFFKKLLKKSEHTVFIEVPHFGVSSKFHRKDAPYFMGKEGNELLQTIGEKLGRAVLQNSPDPIYNSTNL